MDDDGYLGDGRFGHLNRSSMEGISMMKLARGVSCAKDAKGNKTWITLGCTLDSLCLRVDTVDAKRV